MVARLWRGWTATSDAAAYRDYLDQTSVRDLAAAPGNRGVFVLWRSEDERAEFVILSFWESLDAVRNFADGSREVPDLQDRRMLVAQEPDPRDYEFFVRGDLALAAALAFEP